MNFQSLVGAIQNTHLQLQQSALRSVNRHLTIRNWLIGYYTVEFEQNGADRAKYGERLLHELAESINIKGLSETGLRINRQFYNTYPHLRNTIFEHLIQYLLIHQSLTDEFQITDKQAVIIRQSITDELVNQIQTPPDKVLGYLSFTHLSLLITIADPLKRTFYELECMKGNWKVSELKRQINSLYFERSGMSQNPEKLSKLTQDNSESLLPADFIKSPFAFEFLGLRGKDVVYESDLEQALIDHLEEFLMEMGHGFCFEAK